MSLNPSWNLGLIGFPSPEKFVDEKKHARKAWVHKGVAFSSTA
jgi:hypothetical protein